MNRLADFLRSRLFTALIIGFGLAALLASVFAIGVLTGYRKASLAYGGAGDFYRVLGTSTERGSGLPAIAGMPQDFSGSFGNGHGASGAIIDVGSSTITIEDMSRTEIVVDIAPSTIIREGRDTLSQSDLKINQEAVVFGSNDSGVLTASLIRIIPPVTTN
jgi:hypothetical protein